MFRIRPASLSDILAAHALIPEFVLNGEAYFRDRLEGKTAVMLVAWDGDTMAGYAVSYLQDEDAAYIWLAGVAPGYRRHGVFQLLYDEIHVWAKAQGARRLQLKTKNIYRSMLGWLVKHGFLIVKVEPQADPLENWIYTEKLI